MKYFISLFAVVALLLNISSCSSSKSIATVPTTYSVNLALIGESQANKYIDLDYGIKLYVKDRRATTDILKKYDASLIHTPEVNVNPNVVSFVTEGTRRYMRNMGFNLDADVSTDYIMTLTISEYNVSYLSGVGWSGTVMINIQVQDKNSKLVYPSVTSVGRYSQTGYSTDFAVASKVINSAYLAALEDIDWDRIAYFLKSADKPSMEKNKQVSGDGTTALESTIIRWWFGSTPAGADVYWRVISSTPEVKNTNQNYLGTTPYESTQSFDIIGLTYNNSGNVSIEISCEKAGYITQNKRFNIRQAIDQKEISTKFNLIKED